MSGEGLSVSFRRTQATTESNQELLRRFQNIIYRSRVMRHMKWYGKLHSVDIEEHGDEELQKWQQEGVAIKDTFRFCISVYDSWYEDANLYESYEVEDSFVSLALKFAVDNNLMYFASGFIPEWYEQNEEGKYQHFEVKSDDKNIDKICKIWHDYGMKMIQAERFGQTDEMKSIYWKSARDQIKSIMEIKSEELANN